MTTTQNTKTAIENVTIGMMVIPEGRKRAVEVLSIDNWGNANIYKIAFSSSRAWGVIGINAGETITVS
jgi:hypothetical protein